MSRTHFTSCQGCGSQQPGSAIARCKHCGTIYCSHCGYLNGDYCRSCHRGKILDDTIGMIPWDDLDTRPCAQTAVNATNTVLESAIVLIVGHLADKSYNDVAPSLVYDAVTNGIKCYETFRSLDFSDNLKWRVIALIEHPDREKLLSAAAEAIPDSEQALRDIIMFLSAYFLYSPLCAAADRDNKYFIFKELIARLNCYVGAGDLTAVHDYPQ